MSDAACGHDPAQFVTSDEGTSYCPACEDEARATPKAQSGYWRPASDAANRQELGLRAPFDRPLRVFNALQRQADVSAHTQAEEGGSSLRAAGWKVIAERPKRRGWSVPSRPRDNGKYVPSNRQLWEAIA